MEWIELLLFALFFLFPLLQQVLQRRPPPGGGVEEGERTTPPPLEAPPARRPTGSLPPVLTTPPTQTWEGAEAETPVRDERPVETAGYDLAAGEQAEVARVDLPVESMEALEVDREAEHLRLHRRAPSRALERPPEPPSRLATLVGGRDDLRRAVIVAEILGAPRSLR